jgi:hypothetical protein
VRAHTSTSKPIVQVRTFSRNALNREDDGDEQPDG